MPDTSCLELKLSGSGLSTLMLEVLAKGAAFRFQARGNSMAPFIRNLDIVTISRAPRPAPCVGDIAAVLVADWGRVIVHRIVKVLKNGVLLKGDNLPGPDGVFPVHAIAGMVTTVERRGRRVWAGGRFVGYLIALLSRTGVLNSFLLPLARHLKSFIPVKTASGRRSE